MLLPTHLATGQAAYLLACVASAHPPTAAEAAVAVAAAAIPDLDCRQGLVGRLVPPVSGWLEYQFGHRTFTHSLMLQVAVGLVGWWLIPHGYLLALLSGLVSHTLADMMTPAGVGWFWPARVRCVLPGNQRYRMEAMGLGEFTFLGVMLAVSLLAMHLAEQETGTTGLIRAAIGDLAAAREDYDQRKGDSGWLLRVEGKDNRTMANIEGEYPIRGPYRESGFILDTVDGPRAICRSESCDWYASKAVLVRAPGIEVQTAFLRRDAISAGEILAALEKWSRAGAVYLVGSFRAAGWRSKPPTIEATEEGVTLRYAGLEALRAHRSSVLRDVELTIQLRRDGGERLPEPEWGAEPEELGASELLRKWVRSVRVSR